MGWLLTLTTALIAATTAPAAPAPPMSFALVQGSGVDCDPDCPEWIAAQGEIKPGTAVAFKDFLSKLDSRRRPVIIHSNGGSVEDALAIGRLIRARRLAVVVGRTRIFDPPAGYNLISASAQAPKPGYAYSYPAYCLSACAFILAGGVERYASPLAAIGLHEVKRRQSRTFVMRRYLIHYRIVNGQKQEISRKIVSEDKNTVVSTDIAPAAVNQRLAAYFKEMGEDPKMIVDLMGTASPDQIHLMSRDEEKDTGLVTIRVYDPSPVGLKPLESGLDGAPVDPSSNAHATLEAEQTWTLEPSEAAGERQFAAHLVYRRGGAGVVATFSLLDASHLRTRYGVAPGAARVRRVPSADARTTTLFLPNAAFCDFARVGDLYVDEAPLPHPPTQAPGLPDPRAPLLLTPFARVAGISALTDEVCGGAKAAGLK